MAVSPRYCAKQKSPDQQHSDWRPPKSDDQGDDGRPDYPKRSGDPLRRAEWMTVYRYGHLRSAPVVVDAGYARSGNRLHSLQPCVNSTRQSRRLLDGLFPLQRLT